jgi:hypothetical protein
MTKNEQEHERKVKLANEVSKILPETINKTEHYKEIIIAEGEMLNLLRSRQRNPFVSRIKKADEKIKIVDLKNSIINKQKIYESYLGRKKNYENFLDEMSIEVSSNFDNTLEEAKAIKSNVRLMQTIKKWESEEHLEIQQKIEFYLYLNQEIINHNKFSKKNK